MEYGAILGYERRKNEKKRIKKKLAKRFGCKTIEGGLYAKYKAIAARYMDANKNGMNILYIQTSKRGIKDMKSMKLLKNAYITSANWTSDHTISFNCNTDQINEICSVPNMLEKLRNLYTVKDR